jgi:hypothetical protein
MRYHLISHAYAHLSTATGNGCKWNSGDFRCNGHETRKLWNLTALSTGLDAALSLISTISSRIATVFYPIFCALFPWAPCPQAAFDSEPSNSTSALANYDLLTRPALTTRFCFENKCFSFCGCPLHVRGRLSPRPRHDYGTSVSKVK